MKTLKNLAFALIAAAAFSATACENGAHCEGEAPEGVECLSEAELETVRMPIAVDVTSNNGGTATITCPNNLKPVCSGTTTVTCVCDILRIEPIRLIVK